MGTSSYIGVAVKLAEQYCDEHGLDRSHVKEVTENIIAAMADERCLVETLYKYRKEYLGEEAAEYPDDDDMDSSDLTMHIPTKYCAGLPDAKRMRCTKDTINTILFSLMDDCGPEAYERLVHEVSTSLGLVYENEEDEEDGTCNGQGQREEKEWENLRKYAAATDSDEWATVADTDELSAEELAHMKSLDFSSGEMAYLDRYIRDIADFDEGQFLEALHNAPTLARAIQKMQHDPEEYEAIINEMGRKFQKESGGRYFLASDGTIQIQNRSWRFCMSISFIVSIVATVLWNNKRRRKRFHKASGRKKAARKSTKRSKAEAKAQAAEAVQSDAATAIAKLRALMLNFQGDRVQSRDSAKSRAKTASENRKARQRMDRSLKEKERGRRTVLLCIVPVMVPILAAVLAHINFVLVAGVSLLLCYLYSKRDVLWSRPEMTLVNDEREPEELTAQTIAAVSKKKKGTQQKMRKPKTNGKGKGKGMLGAGQKSERPQKKSYGEKPKQMPRDDTPVDDDDKAKADQQEKSDTRSNAAQKDDEKVLAELESKQGEQKPTNVEGEPNRAVCKAEKKEGTDDSIVASADVLLAFLESNSSCLKGSPAEFCQWLRQAEDIKDMDDLSEAVNDDVFFNGSLKRGDGTVGVKGFKRNAFKKALMAAVARKDLSIEDKDIPAELLCPITHVLMVNTPVLAADGYTNEKSAITAWIERQQGEVEEAKKILISNPDNKAARAIIERGVISPITQKKLENLNLVSSNTVRTMALDMSRK